MTAKKDFDFVIVGAGISGINSAYWIQTQLPHLSFTILEARDSLGGTWDFWKYPGIRSDSDLHTFGFSWNPWSDEHPIADAKSIMTYLHSTASKFGIDKHIQYKVSLNVCDWSSKERVWNLSVDRNGKADKIKCSFVIFATGYYDYKSPMEAKIPGIENFKHDVIHPQFWDEKYDYANKRIVVIGSGATAITLIPNLANKAKHVVMLQRSPSYIFSLPNANRTNVVKNILPTYFAAQINRLMFLIFPHIFYVFCRTFPNVAKVLLRYLSRKQLPSNYPLDPHFNPSYFPWQQRLCVCPDGDFYRCIREGKASIATGVIKMVNESSITLESGEEIPADVIVTATGLRIMLAGGSKILVDGQDVKVSEKFIWNTMMVQDIPNAMFVIGYANASWTLGADISAYMIVQLVKVMESKGMVSATPRISEDERSKLKPLPVFDLSSTYLKNGLATLPHTGTVGPWRPRGSYFSDYVYSRFTDVSKDMEFD